MKKIPTVFGRDPEDRTKTTDVVTPGCEWVFEGEGVPTRKWNGTGTMLDENGIWWARREIKPGKQTPPNYVPVHYDEVTGKTQGWEPIEQSPFAKFHKLALMTDPYAGSHNGQLLPGTYELVGPKIQGNEDGFDDYYLLPHASAPVVPDLDLKLSPETVVKIIRKIHLVANWEGVVWHHPDGRMAKLKARDLA